jgi:hypothetical protein
LAGHGYDVLGLYHVGLVGRDPLAAMLARDGVLPLVHAPKAAGVGV